MCKRRLLIGVNDAGEYGREDTKTQFRMLHDQYGDIVKLDKLGPRRTMIFLFSPELCEKMYRVEGAWPIRIAMETLHHYRQSREHIYNGQYGLATRSVECFGRNVIIKRKNELSLVFLQKTRLCLDPRPYFFSKTRCTMRRISLKKKNS